MDNGKPLSSWKEISAYLGCDERTCLRWEKGLGLPIHRIGSPDSKGHVFAYKEELDEWLTARARQAQREPGSEQVKPPRLSGLSLALSITAAVVLIGILAMVFFKSSPFPPSIQTSDPADFRIENSEFVILDRNGREIRRYDTQVNGLCDESFYRLHFQTRGTFSPANRRYLPQLIIRDINGDGRTEVLINLQNKSDYFPGKLICFDHTGKRLWTYSGRHEARLWAETYSPNYALDAVDLLPSGKGGQKRILVIGRNQPDWPSYAAILTCEGKLITEFWNAGRIIDYALGRAGDGDGLKLVLAGTNNEYMQGFLAVFDADRVDGQSPNSGKYHSAVLSPGTETHYLLFPRTALDMALSDRELISLIDVLEPDEIQATAQMSRLIFVLNGRMEPKQVIPGDDFQVLYRTAQEKGNIPAGTLDKGRLEQDIIRGIRYWDGTRWTSTPSRNLRSS